MGWGVGMVPKEWHLFIQGPEGPFYYGGTTAARLEGFWPSGLKRAPLCPSGGPAICRLICRIIINIQVVGLVACPALCLE